MIRHILWKVDGTLFDTYPAITYAISKSLNDLGCSIPMNVIDDLARQSVERCLFDLSRRFKLDPKLLRCQFVETYQTLPSENQPLFSGVRQVCEYITQIGGSNIILTHRDCTATLALLEAQDMVALFDDILQAEQGYPLGPDPALIRAALNKHQLSPAQTLFIGDHALSVQAGQAAGVHTCLFGYTTNSNLAEIRVKDYHQLMQYLLGNQDADV